MKKCGIYRIINKANKRFYVGSSVDIGARWRRHRYDLNNGVHHNIYLQRAWNKYGEESFEFCIFCECSEDEIRELESINLDAYFGSQDCYNLSPCASGGDLITHHPERDMIVDKIASSVRKNINSLTDEEKKAKWGRSGEDNPNYGKKWKKEKRQRASDRMKKRFQDSDERAKMSGIMSERLEDRTLREKISEAQKKRFRSPEERGKMSDFAKTRTGNKNPFFGKKHSDKTKDKISKKNKGKYRGSQERPVDIDCTRYKSVSEAARQLGIGAALVIYRIRSKNKKFDGYRYAEVYYG